MKTVLILGAKSDIAKALAEKFSKNGFDLILGAREPSTLSSFATTLQKGNNKVSTVDFDALDFGSHASFYNGLENKPDVVVLCFGYLGNQLETQSNFKEAEKVIDTNFTGAVSILEIIAKDMEQKGTGAIIGISSVAGDRGKKSNYFYGAAKAGLTAYLSGLRQRLSKSTVTVLTVKPGFVYSKMTEEMDLPPLLTAQPAKVAEDIFKAFKSGKSIVYTKHLWRIIMLVIKNIPEFIFKKLDL